MRLVPALVLAAAAAVAADQAYAGRVSATDLGHGRLDTFQLALDGSGTHLWNWWECGGSPDPETCRQFGLATPIEWTGMLTISTRGHKDGIYTGDDLVSVSLESNLVQCATLFCTYSAAATSAAFARVTLARMSVARAVQMNGLGSML